MHQPRGPGPVHAAAPVLVGVFPGQHPEVLQTAARLASVLRQDLVCAYALTGLDSAEWDVKASIDFGTLHEDERQELGAAAIEDLQRRLGQVLAGYPVPWTLRILVGDPASALGAFAAALGTSLLVVGSPRKKRFGFSGSRLRASTPARVLSQRRLPVLVVPPVPAPPPPDGFLP